MSPKLKKANEIAVLLSDVHYHVNTLRLADFSMRAAIDKAAALGVPLVIAGDLLDQKAIIRGEVAKALIATLEYAKKRNVKVIVLVGNHDKINEKGKDHSLEFIRPWATVVDETRAATELGSTWIVFVPYQSTVEAMREQIAMIEPGSLIIMHQGVLGAFMGEYAVDKSSIDPAELAPFAVISGHYHRAQTIETDGKKHHMYHGVGTFNYIGTPYSITFAEANDGPKGYRILRADGSMESVPLGLRKHVTLELKAEELEMETDQLAAPGDLVWVKLSGSCAALDRIKKRDVVALFPRAASVKLDKYPTDTARPDAQAEKMTKSELMDLLIQKSDEPDKKGLKTLWRELMEGFGTDSTRHAGGGLDRIGLCEFLNFQSYSKLSFDYSNLGLALVSGPTGAGKSTLMDGPAWGLFGITSKEGAADDVKAWDASGPTQSTVNVGVSGTAVTVTRIRGKSNQNDLFWTENDGEQRRGKDLAETQKLLEQRLGVTADLFLTGAYMHQFSRADTFFVAKAKERREVMEKIADQSFPIHLAATASEARKKSKADLDRLQSEVDRLDGRILTLEETLESSRVAANRWLEEQTAKIFSLKTKFENYDTNNQAEIYKLVEQLEVLDKTTVHASEFDAREKQIKQQLATFTQIHNEFDEAKSALFMAQGEANQVKREQQIHSTIVGKCNVCKAPVDAKFRASLKAELAGRLDEAQFKMAQSNERVELIRVALNAEQPLRDAWQKCRDQRANNDRLIDKFEEVQNKIKGLKHSVNPYAEQIAAAKCEVNPHIDRTTKTAKQLEEISGTWFAAKTAVADTETRVSQLNWLYDKSFELRGMIMEKAVRSIERRTNEILERFFDAALRVDLALADSDKLNVTIQNDGYEAGFRQLSGGERCMLKLAFNLSLMRAAEEEAGVKFGLVMLDEALNGLDDGLKVKAFALLQQMETEYESVLLIDHCEEFKGLFASRFRVDKANGHSQVESSIE